jgi:unsaturated pyranuronate lyase
MTPKRENNTIHENLSPGRERTVAHLENLMVAVYDFTAGPMEQPETPHSHDHEQITFVAEGELLFFKGKEEYHLIKGDLMTVPSGIPHCIQIMSDHVRLVDSFCPLRKEFLRNREDKL